jgi:hypothetical protein
VKSPDDSERTIESVENMTAGEYIWLLDNDERWWRAWAGMSTERSSRRAFRHIEFYATRLCISDRTRWAVASFSLWRICSIGYVVPFRISSEFQASWSGTRPFDLTRTLTGS